MILMPDEIQLLKNTDAVQFYNYLVNRKFGHLAPYTAHKKAVTALYDASWFLGKQSVRHIDNGTSNVVRPTDRRNDGG
jgi:hypothetical protein